MKRGQIQDHVLIYILTLIITGVILLYGYNAILKSRDSLNREK